MITSTAFAYFEFIGRALLATLFLISATRKLFNPERTRGQIAGAGIPLAGVAYPVTLVLEYVGALLLLSGYYVTEAAFALALFTTTIAVTMHRNWSDRLNQNMFLMNMTVTGGLLVLAANGPGPISIASWIR